MSSRLKQPLQGSGGRAPGRRSAGFRPGAERARAPLYGASETSGSVGSEFGIGRQVLVADTPGLV